MMTEPIELQAWKGRLDTSKQGPKKNMTNLMLCLRNIRSLGPKLTYNDLTGNIEWNGREFKDSDYVDIRLALEADGYEPNAKDVPAAVIRTAEDRTYNPVADYLNGLIWDGTPRIGRWLSLIFGAEDTKINQAFGRLFLIGAAARALQPGCKMDNMLIIKGEQGIKKDQACEVLFGDEFITSSITKLTGDQTAQALQGVWAANLGELEALNTSILMVKNFLSLRRDRFRPTYGKHFVWRPRRMVFIGSTNEDTFLKDPTGARRFWPFDAVHVDLDLLRARRDQLWAEAVHEYKAGEQWWIDKGSELDHLAQDVQRASYKDDAWAERINDFLVSDATRARVCVTLGEIYSALYLTTERLDEKVEARVIGHLKHLGWWKHRCLRHGKNVNWWFPPEALESFKKGRPRGA